MSTAHVWTDFKGPCPICNHKGWCRLSPDGDLVGCHREANGAESSKTTTDGNTIYFHRIREADPATPRAPRKNRAAVKTANAGLCHKTYTSLLAALELAPEHRNDLLGRGLTDEDIEAKGYRTLPVNGRDKIAMAMRLEIGAELFTVPGFRRTELNIAKINSGGGHLIIPVRDTKGRIVAIKFRLDNPRPDGPRYVYLSSRTKDDQDAPSPGTPVHVPIGTKPRNGVVRLTEGELKADVATYLSGFPTIAVAGVGSWKPAISALRELDADRVQLAYDADAATNSHVGAALHAAYVGLKEAGFAVDLEVWDGASGKGIDDALKAGIEPQIHQGKAADDEVRRIWTPPNADHPDVFEMTATNTPEAERPTIPISEGVANPEPKRSRFRLTDLGNAERFVDRHGKNVRYCHPWKKWVVFDGKRWTTDNTAAARRMVKETTRNIYAEAAKIKDDDDRKLLISHARSTESRDRQAAMLKEAEMDCSILPEEMDQDLWAFNVLNGTIDLRTGELRPHRREDYITQLCRVNYDPKAECPLWESTLRLFFKQDEELIRYFQKIIGYTACGVVRDHILPICYGEGSNGKSTMLGTVIDVYGPDYAMKAAGDLLMAKQGQGHPTDKADLFGKRLVVAIETEDGRRLSETTVKELTGGDRIRARRMREDFWEFKPTHTAMMATNHKPEIKGDDNGIWRRVKIVPFSVQVDGDKADKAMTEKLQAEFPGILAWCVRGCLAWQAEGLNEPTVVSEATGSYRQEQDVLGRFLDEFTMRNAAFKVKAGLLYARYKRWIDESGERKLMTQTAFGTAIEKRGIEKRRSGGIWYEGIGLRSEGDGCSGDADSIKEGEI